MRACVCAHMRGSRLAMWDGLRLCGPREIRAQLRILRAQTRQLIVFRHVAWLEMIAPSEHTAPHMTGLPPPFRCVRPYRVERLASRPLCESKQRWAS
jgi:hypothetical protein